MKTSWRAPAVVMFISVFALVSCDSTEPDRIDTRAAALSFTSSANVPLFNCFELMQDTSNPPDGVPDADLGPYCEPALDDLGAEKRADRAVPWRYSIVITIIRAGTVNEEVAISDTGIFGASVIPGDGVEDFVSLTDYDPDETPVSKANVGDLYYVNGKQVSLGNASYLAYIGYDPGIPNILQTTPSFDFNLNTGDTVIVRARKQGLLEGQFLPSNPPPLLKLVGKLVLAGTPVVPQGTSTSPTEDKGGVNFSYTVQ